VLEELMRRRTAQAGGEGPAFHSTVGNAFSVEAERLRVERLPRKIVEGHHEPVTFRRHAEDDERGVLELHRHTCRAGHQIVALGVHPEVLAEIGEDARMGHFFPLVEPLPVARDAKPRQLPAGGDASGRRGLGGRRHGKAAAQNVTAPSGSGHWL
jgi:hypothetical protein